VRVHTVGDVAPAVLDENPAGQLVQLADAMDAAYVLAWHGVQLAGDEPPLGLEVPAGHGRTLRAKQ
jgi:hypothetical protein